MPKPKSGSSKRHAAPSVRPLRKRDVAELARLRQSLWPECGPAEQRSEIRRLLARSRLRGVLVLDRGDGRLGGFIELSVHVGCDGAASPRVGYVEGWFVDAGLRGAGWGRRLIAAAEHWTAARGLTELASDSESHNPAGIAAHRAVGFRETFRGVLFLKKIRRQVIH
ncbi:MAG: GNAT family N-acetyltransferase [Opitutae bacterium]|nr:GNAT family N-acetyltransferase [Opitutae bacterium]